MQNIETQVREVSQAMIERVDKMQGKMLSIHSTQKTEAHQVGDYKI